MASDGIRKAVILAAGLGSRLKPLTEDVPKCLTELNGEPILITTLKILESNGIKDCVIVIGYLGEVITKLIGYSHGNMSITYITNTLYGTTNSMYSAWLARKHIEEGCLLIEGDSVFEETLVSKPLQTDHTCWVLDQFTDIHNGSMSITGTDDRIHEIRIVRGKLPHYKSNYYKSTGVLKINPDYGALFSKWLDDDVKKGIVDIYYDLVIAKHLAEAPIYVCNVSGAKWFEIDDFYDLRKAEKIFASMKFAIVIMDGATDHPQASLMGKTPIEAALTPNIDFITSRGRTGRVQTMHPGLPVGSIVANLGLLGYKPARYYPNGRASFEALAQDIFLGDNDVAFRCNLISLEDGAICDFSSNMISTQHGNAIIQNLVVPDSRIELYAGQSYRNLLVLRDAKFDVRKMTAHEPHVNHGTNIESIMIEYDGEYNEDIALLNRFLLSSIDQIKNLNTMFHTQSDMIWLWSGSFAPRLPSFSGRHFIDGSIVSGLAFMRGIGMAAGLETKEIPGATGDLGTNLQEKFKCAKNFLRYNDLVLIHINAPDEESHSRNPKTKIQAIQNIDRDIVGPLVEFLETEFKDNYRIAVLSDHHTLLETGTHSREPVPYMIYGAKVKPDNVERFSETDIANLSKTTIKSDEFMDILVRGGRQ